MDLPVNTLVTHKRGAFDGIGCVTKVFTKSVRVNIGMSESMTCKFDALESVDVSRCRELKFVDFKIKSMNNSPDLPKRVVIGNIISEYVGIGWIKIGVVTVEDLQKYPRVVD